jgi:hypothetical protein
VAEASRDRLEICEAASNKVVVVVVSRVSKVNKVSKVSKVAAETSLTE